LHGWNLMMTVFLNLEPFMLTLVGSDCDRGHQLTLHLTKEDVNALASDASRMNPQDMIEAIAPSLRVVSRDGRFRLVAIQQAEAPATATNFVDPAVSETVPISLETRRCQRLLVQRPPPPKWSPPRAPAAPESDIVAFPGADAITNVSTCICHAHECWSIVREEVLMIQDHFLLVWVETSNIGDAARLTVQNAGCSQLLRVNLSATIESPRRSRVFAQRCDVSGLPLLLYVEEIDIPSLLIVRIMEEVPSQTATAESGGTVLCMSRETFVPIEPHFVMNKSLQQRRQMLNFLSQVPVGVKDAVQQAYVLSIESGEILKVEPRNQVKHISSPDVTSVDDAACSHSSRNHGCPGRSPWQLLLQQGRRMDFSGAKSLLVVRVYHRWDPYSLFKVSAFSTRSCKLWELLISAEDAADSAGCARLNDLCNTDSVQTRMAKYLATGCCMREVAGTWMLGMEPAEDACDVQLLHSPQQAPDQDALGSHAANKVIADPAAIVNAATNNMPSCVSIKQHRPERITNLHIGGRFLNSCDGSLQLHHVSGRQRLHSVVRRLGGLDLVLTLELLSGGRVHALTAYHPASCTTFEVVIPTRNTTCPEKACIQATTIAGARLVFMLGEVAFPHSVYFVVRDPISGKEIRYVLPDDELFDLLPRSYRHMLYSGCDELLQHGALGDAGMGTRGFTEMPCGVLGTVDSRTVPVLRAPLSLGTGNGVIGSCSFWVKDQEFEVSVAYGQYGQTNELVLNVGGKACGPTHSICLPRGAEDSVRTEQIQSMCMYSEVVHIGGTDLLVCLLQDISPYALRVAMLAPSAQNMFQMVVLDSLSGCETLPYPDVCAVRQEALDLYKSCAPAAAMTLASAKVLSTPAPRSADTCQSEGCSLHLMRRTTQKLPTGEPLALSVVRERLSDGTVQLFVLACHPVTGMEVKCVLKNPLLSEVLHSCGIDASGMLTVTTVDAASNMLAERILSHVRVHPDGNSLELL